MEEEQLDEYYLRAFIDGSDWHATDFKATLYKGRLYISGENTEYSMYLTIRDIGTPNERFNADMNPKEHQGFVYSVIESSFTLLLLDTVNQEVSGTFRYVLKLYSDPLDPLFHIEFGQPVALNG